jgi:hypothetical protein
MAQKFNNKYRIESARLRHWDYGRNASYFLTICTQNRQCYFGNVINQQMQLTELGLIANECWIQIPNQFPFVKLGEYVIMPNHVHGIIVIDKPMDGRATDDGIDTIDRGRDAINRVSTASAPSPITPPKHPVVLRETKIPC